MIALDSTKSVPLVAQICEAITQKIKCGALRTGARLPSVRALARECAVSTLTVTNAYNRLVAEGFLEARRASGYFVSVKPLRMGVKRQHPSTALDVDSSWLLQRIYEDDSTSLKAGCGWLPESHLYTEGVKHALGSLAKRSNASFARYGNPYGYLPLRQQIQTLLASASIDARQDQILLTHGATQALELLARSLLQPSDTVLVDDPGYCNLFPILKTLRARTIGVERTAHGPNVEALQALAQRYSPKAFFTSTNLHNPTGSSYAPSVAYQILRLAEQFDFRIVEDDIFAGLAPVPCQAIASLDQLKRVAYVGSFSKIISPSLRVGFIACNEDLAQRVLHLKMSSGLTTSELNEQITHAILVEGHHRSHMTRLRHELNVGQQTVCDRLAEAGLEIFHRPLGGLFVWARFQKPVDLRDVTRQAAAKGIMLAPGYLFRPEQQSSTWLRFNVAHSHNPKLYDFLKSVS